MKTFTQLEPTTSPQLTLFAVGFPARTFHPQALAKVLLANARACGISSLVSSASAGPSGSSSKTSPGAPSGGSMPWRTSWDSKATRRFRSRSQPKLSGPRTGAQGSSWSRGEYPTPTASRYGSSNNGDPHDGREGYATAQNPSLHSWAAGWPTPSASEDRAELVIDHNYRKGARLTTVAVNTPRWQTPRAEGFDAGGHRGKSDSLHAQVKLWPTATASDANSSGSRIGNPTTAAHPGTSLTDATCRSGHQPPTTCTHGGPCQLRLNPHFVAWLMGFPLDWLDVGINSKPLATRSSRRAPKSPATSSSSCSTQTTPHERLCQWLLQLKPASVTP